MTNHPQISDDSEMAHKFCAALLFCNHFRLPGFINHGGPGGSDRERRCAVLSWAQHGTTQEHPVRRPVLGNACKIPGTTAPKSPLCPPPAAAVDPSWSEGDWEEPPAVSDKRSCDRASRRIEGKQGSGRWKEGGRRMGKRCSMFFVSYDAQLLCFSPVERGK
jgi:hypothetical protein